MGRFQISANADLGRGTPGWNGDDRHIVLLAEDRTGNGVPGAAGVVAGFTAMEK